MVDHTSTGRHTGDCTASDRQITDRMLWMAEPAVPTHLAELDVPPVLERKQSAKAPFHPAYPSETVAMSTLIEYLITSYGQRFLAFGAQTL